MNKRVDDADQHEMIESELVTTLKKGKTLYMNSQQRYKRRQKEKHSHDSTHWPLGGGIDPGQFSCEGWKSGA